MKKTPTIMLPSDASVEMVAVAAALLGISGTERNPTVALRGLQHYLPYMTSVDVREEHRSLPFGYLSSEQ